MTGSSELALAMRFLEKSLSCHNIDNLINDLFESLDQLALNCCVMITIKEECFWFSPEGNGSISPLEKELIEMCDKEARFLDFGVRTIINYPQVSLLIKNMPLDDMERYGRIKDLMPVLLSAVNSKVGALSTEEALTQQGLTLLDSFSMIRGCLYQLGLTLVNSRTDSINVMNTLVEELSVDFLRMGLEEDQEEYLLARVEGAIEEAMNEMDAGKEIRASLTFILNNLNNVMDNQNALLDAFTDSLANEATDQSGGLNDNVELF